MNRSVARRAATGLLGVSAGFQAALAGGAPWGAAAFGGGHPGVLPDPLRATSAAAAVVYSGLAYLVWSDTLGTSVQRRAYATLSGMFAVGAAMNAISPSMVERAIWTPAVGALSYSLWRARPDRVLAGAAAAGGAA
jgi:hypothetical protein